MADPSSDRRSGASALLAGAVLAHHRVCAEGRGILAIVRNIAVGWAWLGLALGMLVAATTAYLDALPLLSPDGAALLAVTAAFYLCAGALFGGLLGVPLGWGPRALPAIRRDVWPPLEWLLRVSVFWLVLSLLAQQVIAGESLVGRGRAMLNAVWPTVTLIGLSVFVKVRTALFRPSWLLPCVVLGGLVVGGLTQAVLTPGGQTRARSTLSASVPKGGQKGRVLVVGLDGLDPRLLLSMIERGELPQLGRLFTQGAFGEVSTLHPTSSPIIWTTIATGKLPSKHGIRAFVVHSLPGMKRPIHQYPYHVGYQQMLGLLVKAGLSQILPPGSSMRRTKALWNILTDAGRPSAFVNWWASWPAENVGPGVLVTDRLYFHERFPHVKRSRSELVFPPGRYAELGPLVRRPDQVPASDVERFVRIGAEPPRGGGEREYLSAQARTWLAIDQSHLAIARELRDTGSFDLFVVYLRGTDLAGHTMNRISAQVSEAAAWRVLEESYRTTDRALGALLEGISADTTVVVCSDHGFGRQSDGTFGHREAPPGVLLLAGPDIEPGARLRDAAVQDIGTTILYLLGYPVGRDMDGRVLVSALRPRLLETRPIEHIESYDRGERESSPRRSDADADIKEQLRSLGYIQ